MGSIYWTTPKNGVSMRPFIRRSVIALAFSTLALAMTTSAVQAYSVNCTNTLSPSSGTVSVGSYLTSTGTLTYNNDYIPSPIYYQHAFPYLPFKRPIVNWTDWGGGVPTFNIVTDPVNGGTVWMARRDSSWIVEPTTVSQQAKAQGEFFGSGYTRYGTGTGHNVDRNCSNYSTVS
jgi:hypothetical protein